ncbi:MAG: transposase [Candidatus Moranbacteria bacterium RIFOXYA2_FULL_43_15]|nr:MAG: transposase [Candidatus Moranbacteria bacterium RIFOXYA2_FULL_43_15]
MFQGKYIFAQITEFVSQYEFDRCVKRYRGNKQVRNLTCHDQFLSMVFGQLTNLKSLSGIVLCLNAHREKLYHLGFRAKKLILSTLTRANENRNWEIYRDLAQLLIGKARQLYVDDNDFKIELDGAVYAIDSTIIDLCLGTFPWAHFRKEKAAVKIHTQLDLRGNIPSFFLITTGKTHDLNFLDAMKFEENAFYVMDRGYYDFARLYRIHKGKAFFIIRAKDNLKFSRLYSRPVEKETGVRCDQIIKLDNYRSQKEYPEKLRRIKYYDAETDQYYVFLTNDFELDAEAIAELYKHRWKIELFFKWIKQHLKIEVFWGYSANAVKTHVCVAICTFLLGDCRQFPKNPAEFSIPKTTI